MKAPARLGLYGLGLVIVFIVAGFTANAVVPEETAQNWVDETAQANQHGEGNMTDASGQGGTSSVALSLGLGVANDGYQLTDLVAPAQIGSEGPLSLVISGPDGQPMTDFQSEHEKELHLIVVRADGQHFRHVHPKMSVDGTWSIPWQWDAAGTYRVFTDFVPAATGVDTTISNSVQVAGDYDPVPTKPATATKVDGFEVDVKGDLVAGESTNLPMPVRGGGQPVTDLEPYLGAFGHLVALREGDLAYLHGHPSGEAPHAVESSGPEITFEVNAPTPGRYLLYLNFQVDGRVHTAPLTIDARTEDDEQDRNGSVEPGDDHGGDHE